MVNAHLCVFQGQTWSIDDEGSTRDDFYDDEDLYSGSGSGCKCVAVGAKVMHASPDLLKCDSCWISIS